MDADHHPTSPHLEHSTALNGAKLNAKQEEFCRRYVMQPVAARAAVLAGYARESAKNQGYRLLHHAEVLVRIAELRAERGARYEFERDTMHDKLDALYADAMENRNHSAAVAAVRLQATLGGLLRRRAHTATAEPGVSGEAHDDQRRMRGAK